MAESGGTSRRGLVIGGLVLAGIAWGWQRFGVRPPELAFEEIDDLPGWRVVSVGEVSRGGSAASAVFLGLDPETEVEPLPPGELCTALFGDAGGGAVPMAMFTDAFCPWCRVLTARLVARGDPMSWLDLPLLGPASEMAARASVAAELQGGGAAFRTRLMAAPFRPSSVHVAAMAREAGLDADRLLTEMDGPEVAARLRAIRAAAETLGVFATPALVIGRTVALGNVESATLDRLIALEGERSGTAC